MAVPIVAAGVVAVSSIIAALIAAGDSPRDEATRLAMEELLAAIPGLGQTTFTEGEVQNKISDFKESVDISTDISKGAVGTSLAEGLGAAGVPKGHPSSSIFVSENAPLDAGAVRTKAGLDKFGLEFIRGMDEAAKNRILQAYAALIGIAVEQPGQTSAQRGVLGGLNALDIFSTGAGNLASLLKEINSEPIKLDDGLGK